MKYILILFPIALIGLGSWYYIQYNTPQKNTVPRICTTQLYITNNDDIVHYLPNISQPIPVSIFDETIRTFNITDAQKDWVGVNTNNELIINRAYFSEFVRRDATAIETKEHIGTYVDTTQTYSPPEIITSLLTSQLINTYWHLGAELCVTDEYDDEDVYIAYINGTHEYCTNECSTENYSFAIQFDKQNGKLTLLPPKTDDLN